MTKIKICGLCRPCDIAYVNAAKPDYVGFILHYPKSHRNVSPETAALLRRELSPDIRAVGVFVDQPKETVAACAREIGLDVIQLHGQEDDAYIAALREMTALPVWKAFRVRTAEDIRAAQRSTADMVLLDSGTGSGETFDWTLLRDVGRAYILAGGLTKAQAGKRVEDLRRQASTCLPAWKRTGRKINTKSLPLYKRHITEMRNAPCVKEDSASTAVSISRKR